MFFVFIFLEMKFSNRDSAACDFKKSFIILTYYNFHDIQKRSSSMLRDISVPKMYGFLFYFFHNKNLCTS
jgi:hypothetical protein